MILTDLEETLSGEQRMALETLRSIERNAWLGRDLGQEGTWGQVGPQESHHESCSRVDQLIRSGSERHLPRKDRYTMKNCKPHLLSHARFLKHIVVQLCLLSLWSVPLFCLVFSLVLSTHIQREAISKEGPSHNEKLFHLREARGLQPRKKVCRKIARHSRRGARGTNGNIRIRRAPRT